MFNFFSNDFDVQQSPFASIADDYQHFVKNWSSKTWLGRSIYLFSTIMLSLPQVGPIVRFVQKVFNFNEGTMIGDIKPKSASSGIEKLSKAPSYPKKSVQVDDEVDDEIVDFEEDAKDAQEKEGFENDFPNDFDNDEAYAKSLQQELNLESGYFDTDILDLQAIEDEEYAKSLQEQFNQLDKRGQSGYDIKNQEALDDEAMARKLQEEWDEEISQFKETRIGKAGLVNLQSPVEEVNSAARVNDQMTLEEMEQKQKEEDAAYQILNTPGFIACTALEDDNDKDSKKITVHELQAGALRAVTTALTKDYPQAISVAALKTQRDVNFEQYLAFLLKQFSHIEEVVGLVTLPSGKKMKLEGFFADYTAPMVISSYETFSKKSSFFKPKDNQWILSQFNQMIFCDYVSSKETKDIVEKIQDPTFVGPLMLQVGCIGHCALLIFVGDYLLYTDRGCVNTEPGTNVFYIPDRQLITENLISEAIKTEEIEEKNYRMVETILSQLNAELVHYEYQTPQNIGNCTHATMDGGLDDLMAIKQLFNANGDNLDSIKKSKRFAWESAFAKVKHEHARCSAFEKKTMFDAMISDIEEWLTHETSIGKIPLRETYLELLTYWLYTPSVKRDPTNVRKVEGLLEALGQDCQPT